MNVVLYVNSRREMQSIANNSGSRRLFCHSRVVFPCYLSHQPDECIMIPLCLLCLDPMSASWFRSLGQLLLFFFSRGKFSTKFCQITWVSTSFRQSSDKCFFFGVFGWWGHCHQRPWKVSWSWSKLAKRRLAKMLISVFSQKISCPRSDIELTVMPRWVWEVLSWLWIPNYIPLVPQDRQFSCIFCIENSL